ncbi:hypothetical protein BG011_005248 [Mortierella polycephala]|uniref:Oxidoreductase-like domain-containing protein n=1 Tax=Mortierella polycephala TaxID=41804 RepID=A0A9P6U9C0_9FUNG|nr:hypothetical protein BG011_005248 [Mortierella polycephala]
MNYHQTPQAQHVFQGQSAAKPTSEPNANEIKKGYANALPTAPLSEPTTLVSGIMSSLFAPASDSFQYHGFRVPIKPAPPGAEDCCMSGCAHCIYDIYAEDRQEYKFKLAKVLKEIEAAGLPPPPNTTTGSTNAGDAASTSNSNEDDDDMDPSMKAFLELERKLNGS